jgi:fluoride exporter
LNLILGPNIEKILLISAGAVLGANARYWIGDWVAQKWGTSFPFGTFLVNVTGSLLIGLFISLTTERFMVDPRWRFLFVVGFLGAYTTFSTYTLECINLFERGQWGLGLLDALGSVFIGLIAVGLGMMLGRLL